MLLNNIQDYFIFELEYKSANDSEIKLFGSLFVKKNKYKCKIIYDEKEYDLIEYIKFYNNYNPNYAFKIQLRINYNITDLSYMFMNCEELLSVRDNSFDNSSNININKSSHEYNSNNSSEKSDNLTGTEKS